MPTKKTGTTKSSTAKSTTAKTTTAKQTTAKSTTAKRSKPLKNLLTVTVIDGQHYCECTDVVRTKASLDVRPKIKMDTATEETLRKLGVKIKVEKPKTSKG